MLDATPLGVARCRCFHRQAAKVAPSSKHARQCGRNVLIVTNVSLHLVESADMYPDGPALRIPAEAGYDITEILVRDVGD